MKLIRFLYYPIIVCCIALAVKELLPVVGYTIDHPKVYTWLGVGLLSYVIISRLPLWRRYGSWFETFSHEFTHTFVSFLFFHKIHSFTAEEKSGAVWHSGRFGNIFISLAPYCFPLFTYVFMTLALLGSAQKMFVFEMLIGFTAAFHTACFVKQTSFHQPDIRNQGYARSFLFILLFLVFNATILLLNTRKGLWGAVTYLFPRYWTDIQSFIAWIS